jgi:hypothetical protein
VARPISRRTTHHRRSRLVDPIGRDAERPIPAGDVRQVPVVIAGCGGEAGCRPRETDRTEDRSGPADLCLLAVGEHQQGEEPRRLAAVVGLPCAKLNARQPLGIEVGAPALRPCHARIIGGGSIAFVLSWPAVRTGVDENGLAEIAERCSMEVVGPGAGGLPPGLP